MSEFLCTKVEVFFDFQLNICAVELEAKFAPVLLHFALECLLRVRHNVALESLSECSLLIIELTVLSS